MLILLLQISTMLVLQRPTLEFSISQLEHLSPFYLPHDVLVPYLKLNVAQRRKDHLSPKLII
jgi:hypothetical protein